MNASTWRSLPHRVIALVATAATAAALLVAQPTAASAFSCTPFCPHASDVTLVQFSGVDAEVQATEAQYTALHNLEGVALGNVIARRGLRTTNAEATRLLFYDRPELRIELLGLLAAAAAKPASNRTPDEVAALSWLGAVQQRKNVAVANAAITEYQKFYGSNAFQPGTYPQNACTYVPPAPFQSDYPSGPRWIGCSGFVPPIDLGPQIPSQDDFARWGAADVEIARNNVGTVGLTGQAAELGLSLLATSGAVGAITGSLFALPATLSTAIYSAVVPFAFQQPAISMIVAQAVAASAQSFTAPGAVAVEAAAAAAPEYAAVGGGLGISVGAVLGAAATVVIAVTLAIMAIIRAVNDAAVGQQLLTAQSRAQATPVDGASLFQSTAGVQSAMYALQRISTTPSVAYASDAPEQPATQDGDNVLLIGDPSASTPSYRSQALTYVNTGTDGIFTANTRSFVGGWWKDRAASGVTPADPVQQLIVSLWDPSPTFINGVPTDRPGFSYDAVVSTVMVSGRRKWLAIAENRPGYPLKGSDCNDYDADGCFLTDRLPFLEPTRGKPRVAFFASNFAPSAFTVNQTEDVVNQGDTVHLSASSFGSPLTTDGDGDPVTVTWHVAGQPDQTGASVAITLPDPGSFPVTVTASDQFGASRTQTWYVTVGNLPPALNVAAVSGGTALAPLTISGQLSDGTRPNLALTVNWGDGTPSASVPLPYQVSPAFTANHQYTSAGNYPITLTASDGLLTRVVQRTAVISNSAPYFNLPVPAAFTPGDWNNLQPGTLLSVHGSVRDPDLNQTLTLHLGWYDGTTSDLTLYPTGSLDRPVTFSHLVTRSLPNRLGSRVLTMSLGDGQTGTSVNIGGSVDYALPVFSGVSAAPGVAGTDTTVSGLATDANLDAVLVGVNWGDGSAFSGYTAVPSSGAFSLAHTYAHPGSYQATVRATDNGLSPDTTQDLTIVVPARAPVLGAASFTTTPVEGTAADLSVDVSADSNQTGTLSVDWGDGKTSTQDYTSGDATLTLSHSYAQDGSYDVSISALDSDGQSASTALSAVLVADAAPVVDAVAALNADQGSQVSVPVSWTDPGVLDAGTAVIDWGDGHSDSLAYAAGASATTFQHAYTAAGSYPLTVTVTDDGALAGTDSSGSVTVANVAPTLGSLTLTAAPEGSASQLSASVSDPGADPGLATIEWGDGQTSVVAYGADGALSAGHTYADNGQYSVRAVATDVAGAPGAAQTGSVTIANVRPSLQVTVPTGAKEGTPTTLGITVVDPGADAGTVLISWGDGTPSQTITYAASERALSVQHTYPDDNPTGTARDRVPFKLTVTDDDADASITRGAVAVANVAPSATLALRDQAGRALTSNRPLVAGAQVQLLTMVSDPGTLDSHTVAVDWGDGTSTAATAITGLSSMLPHTYAAAGRYRVSASVRDDDTGTVRKQITAAIVTPAAGVATAAARLSAIPSAAAMPASARTALSTAVATLLGPAPDNGGSVIADLAANRPQDALAHLALAQVYIDTAQANGAPVTTGDPELTLAVIARGITSTAIEAARKAALALPAGAARTLALQRVTDATAIRDSGDGLLAQSRTTAAIQTFATAVRQLSA